jgi:hypothetical protein
VLAYLSRYTHRVAISNSRLRAFDRAGVALRYKDYLANRRERHEVTFQTEGKGQLLPRRVRPPSANIEVCGCRPFTGADEGTGPASANLGRRKPRAARWASQDGRHYGDFAFCSATMRSSSELRGRNERDGGA